MKSVNTFCQRNAYERRVIQHFHATPPHALQHLLLPNTSHFWGLTITLRPQKKDIFGNSYIKKNRINEYWNSSLHLTFYEDFCSGKKGFKWFWYNVAWWWGRGQGGIGLWVQQAFECWIGHHIIWHKNGIME